MPRRSHLKSRNGCVTCKKRRVKCQEDGPPCTNCKVRATDCKYPAITTSNKPRISQSKAHNSACLADSDDDPDHSGSAVPRPRRRYIELQLMHRWSTRVFEDIVTEIADDRETWQVTVPDVAMRFDFLLHSIFALTAFEMAYRNADQSKQHLKIALEYETLAFREFRSALLELDPEGEAHDALLYCSVLLMVLAMASAAQPSLADSMIENTVVHFELVRGSTVVALKKPECFQEHPMLNKLPSIMSLEQHEISARPKEALRLLEKVNEERNTDAKLDYEYRGVADQNQVTRATYLAVKNAVWWLNYMFETCRDSKYRGFSLAWLSMCGDDYIKAVKDRDSVALLALMWWGVLMNPLGYEHWYGYEFGSRLAGEIVAAIKDPIPSVVATLARLAREELDEDRTNHSGKTRSLASRALGGWKPVHPRIWETQTDESGGLGNVPGSVVRYIVSQNESLWADSTERLRPWNAVSTPSIEGTEAAPTDTTTPPGAEMQQGSI